jgi:two-component system, cell cycle sensor histidine kinase and response regulator CckA
MKTEPVEQGRPLQEVARNLRTLIEQVPAVIYVAALDETGSRLFINPRIEAMLGFSDRECREDPGLWLRQLHPGDKERVLTEIRRSRDNGRQVHSEYRLLARDSHTVWVQDEAVAICDEEGRPCFLKGVMLDVSRYRSQEETPQKGEAEFRAVFERVATGIALVDMEGRLIESNPALQRMLGYSEEELRNRVFFEFTCIEDAMADADLHKELVSGIRDHYQMEKRYARKDGSLIWGLMTVSLLRGGKDEPEFEITLVEDITERKHLEHQLLQSQKMETVGRLAGGIAHDFNNLLTVLSGYTELSLLETGENDRLKGNLEEITKATERASALTRQLLAFSRRQVMDLKVIDLNVLLKNLDKMLRRIIGEDIELRTLPAKNLGRVKTDPGQIEQVILNLAVNARDAMPKGGSLLIETTNIELDEEYARHHIGVEPGWYVMLSVTDTGCGMPPEVREHIFEPFFTTKEEGKGTGLGLSTVYGIIKQTGGNIWVYSEVGRGTTFKIYLPRVDEETDAFPSRDDPEALPKGNETVLLVEDDSSVRDLVARILKNQGYTILEARNGDEAIRIAREHAGKEIHLLLTDVVMPQMGGRELVARFRGLHPGVKVLFISGYSDNTITHQAMVKPGEPLLQKPFSLITLAKKVRDVLDR